MTEAILLTAVTGKQQVSPQDDAPSTLLHRDIYRDYSKLGHRTYRDYARCAPSLEVLLQRPDMELGHWVAGSLNVTQFHVCQRP